VKLEADALARLHATLLPMVVFLGACSGQPTSASATSPPPPANAPVPAGQAVISGTVSAYTPAGLRPFGNRVLSGWIESGASARTSGPVALEAGGHYRFQVPIGALVRIHIGSGAYQPCAITLGVTGDVTRDFSVVLDPLQLGANLPLELVAESPTLSGQVYEVAASGRRQALRDVRVELDGFYGMGVVTATTLTDADGWYILCGVERDPALYLFASKSGYSLYATAPEVGDSTLDIEMRR
jgi:hypothetical protein